jgi:hypothetical protein
MLERAFSCKDIAVLLPKLISFSAASCTAGDPFLEGDKFLGTFAKSQKATISFVMSARLSVRIEQLRSHGAEFH